MSLSLFLRGATRNRTGDTRIFSPLLYQLSYGTIISLSNSAAEATRFELVVRLPVRQFSKLLVSATHPHFQSHSALELRCKDRMIFLILQIRP